MAKARAKAKAKPKSAGARAITLFADFSQIHVQDDGATGDLADAWTVKATEDRLAVADSGDIVGIGTSEPEDVKVSVVFLPRAPDALDGGAEHVTEASLRVRSGRVVVCGCTDYLPDARRFPCAPGTYRLRASHGPRDRIRLELWPAPRRAAKVLRRYEPPPPEPKKKAAPATASKLRTAKRAAVEARRGNVEVALARLQELADAGDAAAAASVAEILAYRGAWQEMVPYATKLLANPGAVYAGNVASDMAALVRRAAHELGKPSIAKKALAVVPKGFRLFGAPREERPDRKRFEEAVRDAKTGKRFAGRPLELAAHVFALASVFGLDDEMIARWDASNPRFHFDMAVDTARALARRGDPARAWEVIESRIADWYAVDFAQVAPVVLLTDLLLAPLMTPARCEAVLTTTRSGE